jgi:hypothetical protein
MQLLAGTFILGIFISATIAKTSEYSSCKPSRNGPEKRDLHIATCDSRDGWKEFMALRTWNVTGYSLATDVADEIKNPQGSLPMMNVCKGHRWEGFLTKPLLYLNWLKEIPLKSPRGGSNHVILMDSDTFWSPTSLTDIWSKYDCARTVQGDDGLTAQKEILMSTEMSCWVGRYCTQEDIERYYNHTYNTPSFSPFLNSGLLMGEGMLCVLA